MRLLISAMIQGRFSHDAAHCHHPIGAWHLPVAGIKQNAFVHGGHPNTRSLHAAPIPHTGGLAMLTGIGLALPYP